MPFGRKFLWNFLEPLHYNTIIKKIARQVNSRGTDRAAGPARNNAMLDDNPIFDLTSCRLCPRSCGADRFTSRGFCGATARLAVARASLHPWEEPCISGDKGAGTVFFSYCQLGCVYCQNYAISRTSGQSDKAPFGKEMSPRSLAESFLRLQRLGAATIDLVTPTHYAPQIVEALRLARQGLDDEKLVIPAVWNSSGYETAEMVRAIAGDIDIFMPDFKYYSPDTARRYSNALDYPERAMAAVTAMVEEKGPPVYAPASVPCVPHDRPEQAAGRSPGPREQAVSCSPAAPSAENFPSSDRPEPSARLESGVIVRHLVLPGRRHESIALVEELYRRFGDRIILSLMNQYTPIAGAPYLKDFPELRRKLTGFEYDSVVNAAWDAGFTNAYIQQGGTVSESFIPAFDGRGL